MRKIFVTNFLLLLFFVASAQIDTVIHDPKAKEILDKLSKKTKTYKSIKVKFSYTLENKQKGVTDSYNGVAFLKGNQYKVEFPAGEIFCNGKTIWTLMKEQKEVNISTPNPNDESILNPVRLFSIHEKGFKYKLLSETTENGKQIAEIDLIPEKPKTKKFVRSRIKVDKVNLRLLSITTSYKNGNVYVIKISEFSTDANLSDDIFVFDAKKYPNFEVIDGRE